MRMNEKNKIEKMITSEQSKEQKVKKRMCPYCFGSGQEKFHTYGKMPNFYQRDCWYCRGEGWI